MGMDTQGNIIAIWGDQPAPVGYDEISEREALLLEQVEKHKRAAILEAIRLDAPFCNARGPKGMKCRRKTHGKGNHRALSGREWPHE